MVRWVLDVHKWTQTVVQVFLSTTGSLYQALCHVSQKHSVMRHRTLLYVLQRLSSCRRPGRSYLSIRFCSFLCSAEAAIERLSSLIVIYSLLQPFDDRLQAGLSLHNNSILMDRGWRGWHDRAGGCHLFKPGIPPLPPPIPTSLPLSSTSSSSFRVPQFLIVGRN